MSSHRQVRRRRAPGVRGLALSPRDRFLLAACVLGLLAAWLFFAATGPGHSPAASGLEPAEATSLTGTSAPPSARSASAVPTESIAALLPAGDSAAPPAVPEPAVPEPAGQGPAASVPHRITYPEAGMDVVVHPLEPGSGAAESRSIVPPETMDGYWLTPFGTPGVGSDNTTYVIGHSWEGLDAPFNRLSSDAAPGDEFTVATGTGVLRYAVESVTTYTKSTLKDSPVWDAVPNRVVLISCYTEDPWGKNVVVVATPARGP
ncbi:class F sortase [Arthrobacter sp. UYEF36]|uniref:class F sortase n=1 Tax=Arthrobacter sp. UYEF36 TaxID=1756366 RepID=UPI003394856E